MGQPTLRYLGNLFCLNLAFGTDRSEASQGQGPSAMFGRAVCSAASVGCDSVRTKDTRSVRVRRFDGNRFPSIVNKVSAPEYIGCKKRTQGTETSKYLQERTSTETPQVVASERGPGQWHQKLKWNELGSSATMGDSPVHVDTFDVLE